MPYTIRGPSPLPEHAGLGWTLQTDEDRRASVLRAITVTDVECVQLGMSHDGLMLRKVEMEMRASGDEDCIVQAREARREWDAAHQKD